MNKIELFSRLDRLDEDTSYLFSEENRFKVVIVGGSALVLQDYIKRSTYDIDALIVSKELTELLTKYDIDLRVSAYICNFPYNFEDRLLKLDVGGRRIDFFTLSLEDIVISKLYSSRIKDTIDIESEDILKKLNWELLEILVIDESEVKASALNDRTYSELKQSYEEYKRRFMK